MHNGTGCALSLMIALGLASCRRTPEVAPAPAEPAWFEDVTAKLGIDFVHDAGPIDGKHFLPQIIGSGAAVLDFNRDGLLDLLFLQNGGPNSKSVNRLYQQMPDGTFKDVGAGSGLDFAGWNMGVAIGDVNNDGWPDVVITQYGGIKLLLGDGTGKFRDVTLEAGLANPGWGTAACFVDYDRDGWLDLVVVNYVDYNPSHTCDGVGGKPDFCHPSNFPAVPAKLFRNRTGDPPRSPPSKGGAGGGRFQDVSLASGIGKLPGRALGVVDVDVTGDGWPDLFVANDAGANFLWINQRDGTFREEAVLRGAAFNSLGQAAGNMGIAVGDVSGAGRADFFVTHLTGETNTLWRQYQPGRFQDATARWNLTQTRWRGTGFGAVCADFDNDGWPDLALVNGRVVAERRTAAFWDGYRERNQLLRHTGQGAFADISEAHPALCGTPMVGRALLAADLDNDGGVDLVLTQIAGPAKVLRNVAPRRGHWLRVQATLVPKLQLGNESEQPRDAYGAEIRVHAGPEKGTGPLNSKGPVPFSGRSWLTWINPSYSYLASNDPRAHVGLGNVSNIDRLEVRWPDGSREEFPGGPADRTVVLKQGAGKRLPI